MREAIIPRAVERHYNFPGGLNTKANPLDLKPDELSDVRNVRYGIDGAITRRNGRTKLTSGAAIGTGPVTFQFRFYKNDGVTKFHIAFSGQTMKDVGTGPGTAISSTVFTANSRFQGVAFNNNFYYGNGIEAPEKWTGTGLASAMPGSPPVFAYVAGSVTANRLFAVAPNSSTLWFCALGNGEDWTTANDAGAISVATDDGEPITGIREILGQMVIFKKSSMHVLTGADPQTFRLRQINSEIGCIAPYSIATNENSIFFLAQDGVYQFSGGTRPFRVSDNITPTIRGLSQGTLITSIGWVYKNLYELAVSSTGSTNDWVLNYDFSLKNLRGRGGWNIDTGRAVASASLYTAENGQLYTGNYTGHIYLEDTGILDDGSSISWYADTVDHLFGEPERRKKTKRTWVFTRPTGNYTLYVQTAFDGGAFGPAMPINLATGAAALDTAPFALDDPNTALDGGANHVRKAVSTIKNCYSMKLRFSGSGPTNIFGYSIVLRKKYIK